MKNVHLDMIRSGSKILSPPPTAMIFCLAFLLMRAVR